MKKTILLIFLIILSACSNGGGSVSLPFISNSGAGQGGSDKPTSGLGLEYDFEIDEKFLPDITYELKLKNNGDKTIVIREEDFRFFSINRYQGQDVFTQASLDRMKQELFQSGEIVLPLRSERQFNGNLRIIDEVYFIDGKNSLYDEIEYSLQISYDYITEFDNNLDINTRDYEVRGYDVSQAAPVKLKNIELTPSNGNDKLVFTIRDEGRGESSVKIENIELYLGTSSLGCQNYYGTQGSPELIEEDPILDETNTRLLIACDINLNDYEENSITTTKTYGSFSYLYTLGEKEIIKFPEERSSGFE